MMMRIDARVPVRFGPLSSRTPDEAVLTDGIEAAAPSAAFRLIDGHPLDCICCTPRTGAALALATLFRARAIAAGPAFRGVLAVVGPAGEAAVRDALAADTLVCGRFRIA